ncbi:PREDICTED: voltage-dependent T-type calcium channel subunit alpha-1I-like, partial [Priapulus caudatus]|uniref:Voltage-dependent T-type calcium channel subunit alpha-1I-like n=1 Tax=Priapulus caudatus TaxID=37621 RepID=A0ABM1EVM5_PRICU
PSLTRCLHTWFERISMFVILLNCFTLGMYQPCEDTACASLRCRTLAVLDDFIYAFFAAEMVVKCAHDCRGNMFGLISNNVVLLFHSSVEYCLDMENMNLSAIRTIRVLRPLRAINRIPSKVQLAPYFQLSRGSHFEYICSLEKDNGMKTCDQIPSLLEDNVEDNVVCSASATQFSNNTATNSSCVNWNQYYSKCQPGLSNPFKGAISFDNIGLAWVAIFLVISIYLFISISIYPLYISPFLSTHIHLPPLLQIGSFFMINLCLVVIATQFSETKRRETERMAQERLRALSSSTIGTSEGGGEPGGCYGELIKYLAHLGRRANRKITRWCNMQRLRRQRLKVTPQLPLSLRRKRGGEDDDDDDASPELSDIDPLASPHRPSDAAAPPCGDNQATVAAPDGDERRRAVRYVAASLARAASFNTARKVDITCPELLAIAGTRNAALIAAASMAGIDCVKLNPSLFFISCSLVELAQSGDGGLSVLRTFRLLRILKLVRFMPALRRQLVVMLRTVDNVATFFMLLMLFIFVFSILGMNLFGCKFCNKSPITGAIKCDRKNFDSLLWALVTVFQVDIHYWSRYLVLDVPTNCTHSHSRCSLVYQLSGPRERQRSLEHSHCNGGSGVQHHQRPLRSVLKQNSIGNGQPSPGGGPDSGGVGGGGGVGVGGGGGRSRLTPQHSISDTTDYQLGELDPVTMETQQRQYEVGKLGGGGRMPDVLAQVSIMEAGSLKDTSEEGSYDTEDGQLECWDWIPEPTGCLKERTEYSLFLLPEDHPVRKVALYFVHERWFDYTILVFIALNCITLAMERLQIPPVFQERSVLTKSNYVFTVIFTLEMSFKVLLASLPLGKHAISRALNVMDGFLVVISLVDILVSLVGDSSPRIFGILRVFRLLRTLRPLRVISRAPGLKLVVQTLLSSLRPIGNIVLICCTFFIIFGILGVQLFKGKFYYCDAADVTHIHNKTQCYAAGYSWLNQKYNFDNLGQALMALFVLSSKDGWVQIMYTGIDAVGVDIQPVENYDEWRLLYFISFLLLVGFFVLNMFVGVVVENFHKCRASQEQEDRVRREAKLLKKLEKKRKRMKAPPYYIGYRPLRLFLHNVCTSKYFDLAIAAVIFLNVITMAMEFYMMPD